VQASRKPLEPLTDAQHAYDAAIFANTLTFGIGPAGTGKTWWAASRAAEALDGKEIERIVVTRPAIEAGESLGFLPGDLDEKYDPYFRPVRDALEEQLGSGPLEYFVRSGIIEARPLAYLRGATFKNCWVLADEMQNTTPAQMKMFLSRIGENCKVIVNGDLSQQDIPGTSGLADALVRLRGLKGVEQVVFSRADIVRSGLCQAIIERYEDREPEKNRYSASDDDSAGVRRVLRAVNDGQRKP
jgi:phosphate starvation-inducible PhoH-like protein